MKPVQCVMSDGKTPLFPEPMQIGFGSGDVRMLIKSFGAPLRGDENTWTDSLVGRLALHDVGVIGGCYYRGLLNYRRKVDPGDVDKYIDHCLENGGSYDDLVKVIMAALEENGHLPKPKVQGETAPSDTKSSLAHFSGGGDANPT